LIALGESIVIIGATLTEDKSVTASSVTAFVVAFAGAVALAACAATMVTVVAASDRLPWLPRPAELPGPVGDRGGRPEHPRRA
jgi:hypothetical protein